MEIYDPSILTARNFTAGEVLQLRNAWEAAAMQHGYIMLGLGISLGVMFGLMIARQIRIRKDRQKAEYRKKLENRIRDHT